MIRRLSLESDPPGRFGRRFGFLWLSRQEDDALTSNPPAGADVLSFRETDPWRMVIRWARHYGVRLACAESCTGGLVSAGLTAIPGSSLVVMGGVVAYDNRIKRELLGVTPECLERFGAVSEECACQMAAGCREVFGVSLTVSVTGIAGPGGAVPGKPVGTVCFARATQQGLDSMRCQFKGNRDEIRQQAAEMACALLLLTLREGVGYACLSGHSDR